jgi:hypothetical protein
MSFGALPWNGALPHMSVLLSLRLLPFAVWTVFGRSATFGGRVLIAVGYAACPALACYLGAAPSVLLVAIVATYYSLLCLGANHLSALMASSRVTRGAAFILLFVVFLLAPGMVLPGMVIGAILPVGWDLVLCTFSYSVETSRPGATRASRSDCLFFLLVNPTLVYTARGVPLTGPDSRGGLPRASAGALLLFVNMLLLTPFADGVRAASRAGAREVISIAVVFGVVRFLSIYAAHSGLASLQIGLMRLIGWRVPERYCYPLLAVSPMDFWRRWNTYVRVWLEAYVFFPLARHVVRRKKGRAGSAAAAIVTLVVSGLLHDSYVFAGHQTVAGFRMTRLFLSAAMLLLAWHLLAILARTLRNRFAGPSGRTFDVASALLSRLALGSSIVCAAILWG